MQRTSATYSGTSTGANHRIGSNSWCTSVDKSDAQSVVHYLRGKSQGT